VCWNFKKGFTPEELGARARRAKAGFEALSGLIDGLVCIKAIDAPLPSGNKDFALLSVFESEDALAGYQAHPEHVKVSEFVREFCEGRACVDFFDE
jgi:hypothetical protein